jgi:Flp pilus assembly protein TadG
MSKQRYLHVRRGNYNILGTLTLPALFGLAALSIDASYIGVVNAHSTAAAKQAARTAFVMYRQDGDRDEATAEQFARDSLKANSQFSKSNANARSLVSFGAFTQGAGFGSGGDFINSVRVNVNSDGATRMNLFFAPILGVDQVAVQGEVTVAALPRNLVIAHDIGGTWQEEMKSGAARDAIQEFIDHLRKYPFPDDSLGITTFVADVADTPWMGMVDLFDESVTPKVQSFNLCNCTGDFFDGGNNILVGDTLDYRTPAVGSDAMQCEALYDDWASMAQIQDDCAIIGQDETFQQILFQLALYETAINFFYAFGNDWGWERAQAVTQQRDNYIQTVGNPMAVAESLGITNYAELCDLECPAYYCGNEFGGFNATPAMDDCHEIGQISAELDIRAVDHAPAIEQATDSLVDYAGGQNSAYQAMILVVDDEPFEEGNTSTERITAAQLQSDQAGFMGVDVNVIVLRKPIVPGGALLDINMDYFMSLVKGEGRVIAVESVSDIGKAMIAIADSTPVVTVRIQD